VKIFDSATEAALRFRKITSCVLEDVTAATKKKHIGRKQRNGIIHELGLRLKTPARQMNERLTQNAIGNQ
jgi:hypothetical protein